MASITITFDPAGGVIPADQLKSLPAKTGRMYSEYGRLPVPIWEDHDFIGWFTSGGQVTEATYVKATSDHVLTAHWGRSVHGAVHSQMQLNASEGAQMMKTGLHGYQFKRDGVYSREGGFPDKTLTRRKMYMDIQLTYDTIYDTRWDETIGQYLADSAMTLSGQNVWALPLAATELTDFVMKIHWKLKLMMDAAICTRLPRFLITDTTGTKASAAEKYYELINNNREDPKTDNFYVAVPASSTPIKTKKNYFYFDEEERMCRPCTYLEAGSYFLKNSAGVYTPIGVHDQGDLAGQQIYVQRGSDGYGSIGKAFGYELVIQNLTKPTTRVIGGSTLPALFRALDDNETIPTSARYVDRTNEDINLIKDVTNTILLRYRSVMKFLHKPFAPYGALSNRIPFCLKDLVKVINSIVETLSESIPLIDSTNYDVRDLKLKLNEVIDLIKTEDFFYKFCISATSTHPETSTWDLESQFQEYLGDKKLLMRIATEETYTNPGHPMTYLERQFEYEPEFPYQDVYEKLNLSGPRDEATIGRIRKASRGAFEVYTEGGWFPLQKVCHLYRIAESWADHDYVTLMQVLAMSYEFMNTTMLDGKHWLDSLWNPALSGTTTRKNRLKDCADMIQEFTEGRIKNVMGLLPTAANAVSDIARHVNLFHTVSMMKAFPKD